MKVKYATQLRLNPIAAKKISFIAKAEHRSLNNLIEVLVDDYITAYEHKHGSVPQD